MTTGPAQPVSGEMATSKASGKAAVPPIVVPAGVAANKFQLGQRVFAPGVKKFGVVTGGKYQGSQWVYEVRYEHNQARSTWFESQLKLEASPRGLRPPERSQGAVAAGKGTS